MKPFTRAELKAAGIHNSWAIAEGSGSFLYIGYTPSSRESSPQWQVVNTRDKTDPGGHWQNRGHKTFAVMGRAQKQPQLQAAFDWCKARWSIFDWERDPWGSYHPAGTLAKIRASIKAEEQQQQQV